MLKTEKWLTIQQAAEALNVNPKTIRRRIADGSIEARRLGPRLIRVSADSLANFGKPMEIG